MRVKLASGVDSGDDTRQSLALILAEESALEGQGIRSIVVLGSTDEAAPERNDDLGMGGGSLSVPLQYVHSDIPSLSVSFHDHAHIDAVLKQAREIVIRYWAADEGSRTIDDGDADIIDAACRMSGSLIGVDTPIHGSSELMVALGAKAFSRGRAAVAAFEHVLGATFVIEHAGDDLSTALASLTQTAMAFSLHGRGNHTGLVQSVTLGVPCELLVGICCVQLPGRSSRPLPVPISSPARTDSCCLIVCRNKWIQGHYGLPSWQWAFYQCGRLGHRCHRRWGAAHVS